MVCGLQKYSGQALRQRASSPKLQVFNTAMMGAVAVSDGWGFARVRATPDLWGRLVESAVGAELLARHLTHSSTHPALYYWHEAGREVDYVLPTGQDLFALEVKSGRQRGNVSGLDAFRVTYPKARPLVIGTGGLALQDWFTQA